MKKRRLKKSAVYVLYGISFALLLSGVLLLGVATEDSASDTFEYVSKSILDFEEEVKVINSNNKIIKPYNDANVKIVKDFYDYKGEEKSQEESLIYYENTYMPSSGVSYSNGEKFEVVSILEGTVTDVKEDTITGNSITIEHANGITSIYQSITNITVKKGDIINAGFVIGTSSTSNIRKDLNNHLYFELIIDGVCVDPENYYDKLVNEI